MAEKIFINSTIATLQITLFVRQGIDPFNQDGTVSFVLNPGQTLNVTYGDDVNIFLNGLSLFTTSEGDLYSKVQFITESSSELDNLLNTNDTIVITKQETDYVLSGMNTALEAVNDADTTAEMRAAIENPELGLDLTTYNALTEEQKDTVATSLLTERPAEGYPTVASVQLALDEAIAELVDPDNIFVQSGSVDGDGSVAHPFGTITSGLAAVNPFGTIHILSGTYPITTQINVNKEGISLIGEPGSTLLLQANIIPLLVTQPNTTIDGIILTSDVPYPREFIQVGGANTTLRNNTIFGPPQALPMENWIVNRAVVPQVSNSNITVENNTFFSLRTGMYINPNVTGAINNNIVYNTKGGFLVDRALTTFNGNSWGTPPNEFDIVLLAGTTTGPPYDNIEALQEVNNNATISDQR